MKTLQDGLKQAIEALNSIRNTPLSGEYESTYKLIPELNRVLRENPLLETSDNRVLDAIMATVSKPPIPPVKQLVDMLRKAEAWINDECERRGKEDEEYESPAFEMVDEIRAVLTLSQPDLRNLPESADTAGDSATGEKVKKVISPIFPQFALDIRNILTVSYTHLKPSTAAFILYTGIAALDSKQNATLLVELPGNGGYPEDLMEVLTFAKAHGCAYVRLDATAKPITQLPTYE